MQPFGKIQWEIFVSILCEEEVPELPKTGLEIGIDLGITDFAILSNGQKIDNNRFTSKMEKTLKREQRKLSRRALLAKKAGKNFLRLETIKNKRKKSPDCEKVINQHGLSE